MRVLLLDTNVVSILFKPDHSLHQKCLGIVTGHVVHFLHDSCGACDVAAGEPMGFEAARGVNPSH